MFISKKSRNISRRPLPRVAKVEVKPAPKPIVKKAPKKEKVEEPKPVVVEETQIKKPRVKKVVPAVEEIPAEVAPVEEKNNEE